MADKDSVRAIPFRIKLPKGLMSTHTAGFESFGFQFPDKQVVYVYIDHRSRNVATIPHRITGENDREITLLDKLNLVGDNDQIDIDHNPLDPARQTWIIKKGKASILLYNIREDQFRRFFEYANCFAFLKP